MRGLVVFMSLNNLQVWFTEKDYFSSLFHIKNLVVTVNNDGSGGGVLILTKGMNQEEVRVFPNPSKNNVTVTLNDDSNKISEIVIFDFKMNEVKREAYNNLKNKSKIEISRFSSGMYTIMIYTEKGVFTEKLIKE